MLTEDGWFRTRDAGWFDEHGFLYVDGRLDDVIVRGAENISPGEVEEVLMAHAAVAEAAVIGIPDAEWGEAVAAVVVLHAGAVGHGGRAAGLGPRARCARPRCPASSSSVTSCRTRRPGSCCGGCCGTSWRRPRAGPRSAPSARLPAVPRRRSAAPSGSGPLCCAGSVPRRRAPGRTSD